MELTVGAIALIATRDKAILGTVKSTTERGVWLAETAPAQEISWRQGNRGADVFVSWHAVELLLGGMEVPAEDEVREDIEGWLGDTYRDLLPSQLEREIDCEDVTVTLRSDDHVSGRVFGTDSHGLWLQHGEERSEKGLMNRKVFLSDYELVPWSGIRSVEWTAVNYTEEKWGEQAAD